MQYSVENKKIKNVLSKLKRILLGTNQQLGLIYKIVLYVILFAIGYIFLLPILKMISNSFMNLEDLLSPMVNWIPREFYFDNYVKAFKTLNYFDTLLKSLLVTLVPAVIQTIICSIIGYGLANFKFPGKKVIFGLILISYILPTVSTLIPRFILFDDLGLKNSIWAIILPAFLGQGLNSAIFILIFYNFFRNIPRSLFEAAYLDGANRMQIFILICIPLVVPAFITSFLFSFVWYWNETYLSAIFLGDGGTTLQLSLISFAASFTSGGYGNINESIKDAATILVILPLLIVYLILQKQFVEGIDKSGLAGGE